jgi:hypothetical protein
MKLSWFMAVLLWPLAPVVSAQNDTSPAAPAPAADQQLNAVRDPWLQAEQALTAARDNSLEALEKWYVTNLEKLQADTTKLGNLDQVLVIREEKERVTGHAETTATQIAAMPAPLRTLRASFEGGAKKIRDDAATRWDALAGKYLADLEALQVRTTKAGEIDRALLVKTEKERFAAERAAKAPPVPAAPPATAVTPAAAPRPAATPSGFTLGPKLASIEAQDRILSPLSVGEPVLSDSNKVHWTVVSKDFAGYRYTRGKGSNPFLSFKVLTDGLVYSASRLPFVGNATNGIMTEQQLRNGGWHKENAELASSECGWVIFSRNCKAGETFNLRTAKYQGPILLLK